jgi:hypothetical protein
VADGWMLTFMAQVARSRTRSTGEASAAGGADAVDRYLADTGQVVDALLFVTDRLATNQSP